ncbi:CAP domain-containing protein [Desulfosporosinus sp. PR]|uniref:CAP domain-containing protein n=1 Tax=Candidatus Desulfosporosinus nitrosoreducens TaxID=3401928 RepID=UPI0027FFCC74|nr:CAP domain-containing protein [Desulfosporosinus sp. PR]MDQ7092657.1 CAP domain-containing protein [Desulfosporosinus sp. PR]
MKKTSRLLVGIQTVLVMTIIAAPAQATVLIGAPQSLSGSVVTLNKTNLGASPSTAGNVVSLGNYGNQPASTPVTVTQTPNSASSQGTQTVTVSYPTANQSPTITIGQPNQGGNVVSLKNINTQSASVPVTITPTTPTTTTPAAPASTNTSSSTSSLPAIPTVTSLTADKQQMVDMINQERIAAGVSPLKVDLRLVAVGQAKADDMKANNYFDHTSPTYGSPWAMMEQVGLTVGWAGENIAGNNSVAGAMAAFMQSPDHKANILDPRFTDVGIGIAYGSAYGNLYVQEFLQE